MKTKAKLFAWSVVRQKWFQVLNVFGRATFLEATAAAIGPNDVAISMPDGAVSRPIPKVKQ